MKTSKSSATFRPFKDLKTLLESKSSKPRRSSTDKPYRVPPETQLKKDCGPGPKDNIKPDSAEEKKLFLEAMADVRPIYRGNRVEQTAGGVPPIGPAKDIEDETLVKLQDLVKFGKGFIVSDTPEYIEGTGYNVNPKIAKRLHRGDFSIQAHIDLHGLCVADARNTFEKFVKESITSGKRAVLIVHGRGLSSPNEPVLKTKVVEWLTAGPWRKWVIAFSSAKSCDGGAGATYALFRRRPVTCAQRKGKK
jgi:DNA-nicking Smr family endonuclease